MTRPYAVTLMVVVAWIASAIAQPAVPPRPPAPPERLRGVIGDFTAGGDTVTISEMGGRLRFQRRGEGVRELTERSPDEYVITDGTTLIRFQRHGLGRPDTAIIGTRPYLRRRFDGENGLAFRITSRLPLAELRRRAAAATPPKERGDFLPSDLVELVTLDPTIRLDIRYATTNNFIGAPFYSQARAFLQRPAARAAVKAHRWLRQFGFGLLVHDAYRPWRVTKMFWDATPVEQHVFVADPEKGSRHNRGCALDVSLYDLATGAPIEMVSGYDEFSERAYPDYPGGTALQHWHANLLRRALEDAGFTVFAWEWWHFDFNGWERYPIGVKDFENLAPQ